MNLLSEGLRSCVARRPLLHKLNLPRCEARRRFFITGLNSIIYIIYILLPCFCIIFPGFCSVFNKTALLLGQSSDFNHAIIMMKNRLHSNNSVSSETVSVYLFFFFCQKKNTNAYRHSIYYKHKCYLKIKET